MLGHVRQDEVDLAAQRILAVVQLVQPYEELTLFGLKRVLVLLVCVVIMTALAVASAEAQQVTDDNYNFPIENPAYPKNGGPVVAIDEAHFNFHTMEGRFGPLARLLKRDGYIVRPLTLKFSEKSLRGVDVLVVANALAERNVHTWSLPTPSAFTKKEIEAVRRWVEGGGSLFLVADHMPWAGAAKKLAATFGVRMNNGFAMNEKVADPTFLFLRSDGSLAANPITDGRTVTERIDSVASFTGSAFQADENRDVQSLLVLDADVVSIMPTVAWQWDSKTPRVPVGGWYQGAALRVGSGQVAVFGEAAMFSAQLVGPERTPMGMNSPVAPENPQFLLNVFHWLSGQQDPATNTHSTLHSTRKSGPDQATPSSTAGESHRKGGEPLDAGVFARQGYTSRHRVLGVAFIAASCVVGVVLSWHAARNL
jgi:hypothetical protein